MTESALQGLQADYNALGDSTPLFNMTRRAIATGMAIGDSGAAVHASPAALASHYMVPGTLRSNTTSVSTANGTITPDSKCDMRLPVYVQGKGASFLVLRDVLLLDDCPHVLVSLGRLASESGIGTWLAPAGQQSYLILSLIHI